MSVNVQQAIQAAQIAQAIVKLQTTITMMKSVVAQQFTLATVELTFNETVRPLHLTNQLSKDETATLLNSGITLLQGHLDTLNAQLAAIG